MSVTAFLPVYKISASYVVKQGRVWTPLEHMLLRRLSAQSATSAELAKLASVSINLVVEALIELMTAGWIQMHSDDGRVVFSATISGKGASALEALPQEWR